MISFLICGNLRKSADKKILLILLILSYWNIATNIQTKP